MTKTRKRTAKKLVLPLIAIGMMSLMMYLDSANRPRPMASHGYAPAAAARVPHDLRKR